MDIVGIGTEIVECLRIGRMIERHGEVFLLRVFTEKEIRFCQARRRATEHFAAHWAAKEAIFKALGSTWKRGLSWTDIELRVEGVGRTQVVLLGAVRDLAQKNGVMEVFLTMAHCRAYATAHAVALRSASLVP